MRRFGRFVFQLVFLAALTGIVVFAFVSPVTPDRPAGTGRRRGGADAAPNVLVAAAVTKDMPVYIAGVGSARALNSVVVRPQVDGQLMRLAFTEGQDVKKGEVLAKIDPTTYKAQLDAAVAKKAQDAAQLENAKRDLERYIRLAQTSAGTAQQADTQRATVAQIEAQLKSDQAAIDNTSAILAYTNITAPISGRTGIRNVDEGNLVKASDATGIVTITQVQPIAVVFSVPQQQLARINAANSAGPVEVAALGPDGSGIIDRGLLQVVDNQVDATTGTVKLKAEFPNAGLNLWPGAFVNIRLLADTLKNVVVVPASAVQRGPKGPFVYVLREDAVNVRLLTLGLQDDTEAVVSQGLEAGEKVVTTGFGQLSDGAKVIVATADAAPADPAAAPAPPRPRRDPNAPGAGAGAGGQGGTGRRRDAAGAAGTAAPNRAPAAGAPP